MDAHKGAVTDVRFNPFVPFWMASCGNCASIFQCSFISSYSRGSCSKGEDAVVKLWDLRYLAHPVGHIDSHYQGIHSVGREATERCTAISLMINSLQLDSMV